MNPLDPEEFKRQGYIMIDFLTDYYRNIANYPVSSQVQPGYLRNLLPTSPPSHPEPIETILNDVVRHIIPGLTHWQSPHHFAFFPSSTSIAGFLGEMLSTGFGVVGFNWASSPAATELENIVMDWLAQALKLPHIFHFSSNIGGGVILGTTCEAILCTLVAARDQKLIQIGRHNLDKLVVYGSDQTHSALQKAAQIAGINPQNFRAIKTTSKFNSFALSPNSLLSAIILDIKNGLVPCFLCATVGTTAITAVDPLGPLCDVANKYDIWVHVDAAYTGGICICPEFRHFIDGVEKANSFSFNAHKWFFCNLTCCCLWVRDASSLTKSLSTNPEFLNNKASDSNQVIDYKDWQIPLSRKFRALKLWLVLRSYGVDNLRKFHRSHVEMAKTFEELVNLDKRFEIVVPRCFSLVCFRISPSAIANSRSTIVMSKCSKNFDDDDEYCGKIENDRSERYVNEVNRRLLDAINGSGKVCMSHGMVEKALVIRCAIGATLTKEEHVVTAWKVVQEHANSILGFMGPLFDNECAAWTSRIQGSKLPTNSMLQPHTTREILGGRRGGGPIEAHDTEPSAQHFTQEACDTAATGEEGEVMWALPVSEPRDDVAYDVIEYGFHGFGVGWWRRWK
ncbi:tyrosine decarboxylase 1-like [Senna tora]|uniref:Tyrosine decarboxylase 1-like n=1 Tax=Senna tora TaxID=362788 RepID=A0A834XGU5_9FABA|nr:tyrosine decarboxylase 1-like [Senna tora]